MGDEKKQRRSSLDIHADSGSISRELHQGGLSGTAGRKTTFNTSEKSTWVQSDTKARGEQLAGMQKESMKKPKGRQNQEREGRRHEDSSDKI